MSKAKFKAYPTRRAPNADRFARTKPEDVASTKQRRQQLAKRIIRSIKTAKD